VISWEMGVMEGACLAGRREAAIELAECEQDDE
jgi:hypothetical protein